MYLTDWGALIIIFVAIIVIWLLIIFQINSTKMYDVEEISEAEFSKMADGGDKSYH